ncbi:MAG: SPOR domain-containing protein [Candidatus Omnitrophota bacterium]
MSNQNEKNKDKNNVRISENDIKRKLYGDQRQTKAKEPLIKGNFSEDIIKNKLYGTAQPQKEAVKNPEPAVKNDLFSAKKIEQPKVEQPKVEQLKVEQSKVEQSKVEQTKRVLEKAAGQKIIPEKPEIKILPAYQEEIDALKQAIENLEEKLQRTEQQKHKLKVKLVQKRKLINIREGLADLILNKMPEKFVLLVSVIIIMFLLIMFIKFIPKQTARKPQPVKTVQPAVVQKPVEQPKPRAAADARRYTIQVAEYADEQAALSFVKELEAKGFEVFLTTIYRGPNNTRPYFKINVGSFDNFNAAKQTNLIFREKTNITDSFIRETK